MLLVANQKAKYLAKKLNKIAKDKASPAAFEFHNQGSLAYIGNWYAISISGDHILNILQESNLWQTRSARSSGRFLAKRNGTIGLVAVAFCIFYDDSEYQK